MRRCLAKLHAQLKDFDTGEVTSAAEAYRSRGKEDKAANVAAVEDHLRDLRGQKASIEREILSQWEKRDPESFKAQNERPALDLKGETEAEIKAREAVEAKAAEDKRKVEAAPSEKGFTLTGSDRPADVAEAHGQKPMFARGDEAGAGLSVPDVQEIAKAVSARWSNAPDIHVIASMKEAPLAIQKDNTQQLTQGADGKPMAFFHEGAVYLVASELTTPESVVVALLHESLGHYGLRGVFGKDLEKLLGQLAASRPAEIAAKAKEYGLDTLTREDRLLAAEEVLAELSQSKPELTLVRRAIAAIRNWLRETFPKLDIAYSDGDIVQKFILPARDFVERGHSKSGMTGTTFHRAYHGTPHDFEKFDIGKIGTGEGAQAYGWGLYFAGKKEVAEHYKRSLARNPIISIDGVALDQGRDPSTSLAQSLARMAHGRLSNRLNSESKPKDVQRMAALLAAEARRDAGLTNDAGITREREEGVAARLDEIHRAAVAGKVTVSPGRLYEVELTPKEDEYLDWDKPLSEQPQGVREKLAAIKEALTRSSDLDTYIDQKNADFEDWTGRELVKQILPRMADDDVIPLDNPEVESALERGDQKEAASRYLASLGIPGIKYLDGSSRGMAGRNVTYEVQQIGEKWAGVKLGQSTGPQHTYFDSETEAKAWVDRQQGGRHNYVIFDEKHVEVRAKFARSKPQDWIANGPAALKSAASKIDTYAPGKSFTEKFKELSDNWVQRATKEVFDPFIALKKLTPNGYILARMVKSADTSLEATLRFGIPVLNDDGSITGKLDAKGFLGHMSDLNGEHDRFFMWVAGNRSERLMTEGREHLFSADEIAAMRNLIREQGPDDKWKGQGTRAQAYAKAAEALRTYNRAFMDIAEKTGEINAESRKTWERDFYVPYFRVDEDAKISGPSRVKGLARNEVLKKLKGGTEPLGDLLDNTIRNWQHILAASLANQAAKTALKAAVDVGVAVEADEATARQLEKAGGPTAGATYVMDDGEKHWYTVGDPFVLEAISSLETPSINWAGMKLLRGAKRVLTTGVTAAPPFRVRNLVRDSSAIIAQNEMSYNIFNNVVEGYKLTGRDQAMYAQAMFGGGIIRFGNIHDGKHAEHAKRLILDGVEDRTILDTPTKIRDAIAASWDWYQENGDRFENANRMSLVKQRLDAGDSNLEAMFAGRDSMDFTLVGANKGIRFLTQVVPFLNARLQGLYKTGRAGFQNPKRLGYVTGALTLASLALMLAYRNDDEWKKRADWDRDTYFWFKIGNTAFRVPKGFELGGLASLAERGVEYFLSNEMTGKRFAERLWFFVGNTLSLNPLPQLVKPMVDIYANTDSFTGRQIETRGMERLTKPERASRRTTLVAKTLGKAGDVTQLSPVQIDHLIQAYFGWLGTHAAMTVDVMAEPFLSVPKPSRKIDDIFVVGDFFKSLPSDQSRYVDDFYKQSKKIHEVMGDLKQARESRDAEKERQIRADNKDEVGLHTLYSNAEHSMTDINHKIKKIERSTVSSEEKRARIDELNERKNKLAAVIAKRTLERQAAGQ